MEVKTKFNIGDEVFHISDNKVKAQTVAGVGISVGENSIDIIYTLQPGDEKVDEENVYKTKEEVINSL